MFTTAAAIVLFVTAILMPNGEIYDTFVTQDKVACEAAVSHVRASIKQAGEQAAGFSVVDCASVAITGTGVSPESLQAE